MSEEYGAPGVQDDEKDGSVQKKEPKASPMGDFFEWVQSIMTALIISVLIFVFLGRGIDVIGTSMVPTLQDNDKLFISGLFYTPEQGDIVVLRVSGFMDEPIVKRIIAVAGQTVDIDFDAGIVYVDGEALEEDYTNSLTTRRLDFDGEITVPEGCVFVMGDNRNASADSRHALIGCVDVRGILGKAYLRLFPFSGFGFIE